jgi:amino acid adenylation domain-containing protein
MTVERLSIKSVRSLEREVDPAAASLARLAKAGGHSVSIRLRGRTADDHLRRIRAEWSAGLWPLPDADVWLIASSSDPESEVATARRQKEQDLDVADPSRCRIVLISYRGGVVDIVLSADRRSISRAHLLLLAESLQRDSSMAGLPLPYHRRVGFDPRGGEGRALAVPAADIWGLGGLNPGTGRDLFLGVSFEWAGAEECLMPAIALTLTRFRGGGGAMIATLVEIASDDEVGPREALALFTLPDSADRTIADFAESCGEERRFAGWHSAETDRELRSAGLSVDACLWFDITNPTGSLEHNADYKHAGGLAYPFNISLERSDDGGLHLNYSFDLSVYHRSMIESFDRSVSFVLRQLKTSETLRCADEILLVDREELVATQIGSGVPAAPSAGDSLIGALQALVASQPDAPAITFQDDTLTYAEFDQLSSRYAAAMRSLGVRKNHRVGVCVERSLELVPLLVAVLKCGATYVPIDPSTPTVRKEFIIADADMSLLIVSNGEPGPWTPVRTVQSAALLTIDVGAALSDDVADHSAQAYIIYTSGSTGHPKGVLISQKNVLALVEALRFDLELSSQDRWTLFHSAAFDFSTWEIWGCLLTGGHLFVVSYFLSRSPDEFLQLLADRKITVLNQTPTAFAQLQDAFLARHPDLRLRLVIFGGETLDTGALLPWMDSYLCSDCRIFNMYGITETTVHVTAELITRRHSLERSQAVGAPIHGWLVYIKDPLGRHLPRGLTGEIHVGGYGLATGYWNNPDENEARFEIDKASGQRLYRSGDRGRLRPDGCLDHLGRLDNQVKLRGFRVELDEIRSVILQVVGVSGVMVILREGKGGDSFLQAFVTGSAPSVRHIRAELSRTLPDYMVPRKISLLERFPLTVNGKFDVTTAIDVTDRQPAEDVSWSHADGWQAEDGTDELAAMLARSWSSVFGQTVSSADNFFDLGGDSLIAVKLAAGMRELNCPLGSVRDIFVYQTPDRLAQEWRDQLAVSPR